MKNIEKLLTFFNRVYKTTFVNLKLNFDEKLVFSESKKMIEKDVDLMVKEICDID